MAAPPSFRRLHVIRALRGAADAGVELDRCEIDVRTGNIILVPRSPDKPVAGSALDQWLSERGQDASTS